jgi:perosamine synthetase
MTSALTPLPSDQDASGRSFGDEEIVALTEALRSGNLFAVKGQQVKRFEAALALQFGVRHAYACSSGSAAVHAALAAINPEPGDEIITTSITDMGALTPILFQGAIPVFADVDPNTLNVTAETIAPCVSPRTRAIIVTHLFGHPCEMEHILTLAQQHKLPVIEDAAQAPLARSQGRLVGTLGAIGCFSLQQGKHMTSGEGGFVLTNDDALARRMYLFINKAWGYGDAKPDHYFLALNYRMSELQGAVAGAQLQKLPDMFAQRQAMAQLLLRGLRGIPGVELPEIRAGDVHAFWRIPLLVDETVIAGGPVALAAALRELEIPSAPRYIQKPAFQCEIFREQRTLGESRWPFTLARPEAVDYTPERYAGTFAALARVLVLPFNERFTEEHVQRVVSAVRTAVAKLCPKVTA